MTTMPSAAQLWIPPNARMDHKKAPPPKLGEAFGQWSGRDLQYLTLPGGGVLQFDLSKLTLADYRAMRDHYQINSSLSVLQFMIHQLSWRIECDDARIQAHVEENLREMWTRLIRAVSQAYWSGYAPTVIQWENNTQTNKIDITKFKDLVPEHCSVNWKAVDGWAPQGETPPKHYVFDGMKQIGVRHPIPVENTFWYPLLMENGDYYGRKLLRPAFPSWFFSILIHLFVNRYFERFGEPLPVGRADYTADVEMDGEVINGRVAMERILSQIRNRAVTVLPSDRTAVGDGTRSEYDFDIEYLESQMRGADFERYLTRLDEEMSIGLFTPLLLLRTADVGSYNLGVGHMQMYLWMLNALAGDLKEYIDKYVIDKMVAFNFGPNAAKARWVPRKMGKEDAETIRAIVTQMMSSGGMKADIDELAEIVGVPLEEVEVLKEPIDEPDDELDEDEDEDADDKAKDRERRRAPRDRPKRSGPRGTDEPRATGKKISARVHDQITKAYAGGLDPTWRPDLGHRRALESSLRTEGADSATAFARVTDFYKRMDRWFADVVGAEIYESPDEMATAFDVLLDTEIDRLGAD